MAVVPRLLSPALAQTTASFFDPALIPAADHLTRRNPVCSESGGRQGAAPGSHPAPGPAGSGNVALRAHLRRDRVRSLSDLTIEQAMAAAGDKDVGAHLRSRVKDDDDVSARPESYGCERPGGTGANVTQEQDLAAIARSIVDGNRFMALGTADASGTPCVSPVWYAPLSYRLEAFNRRSEGQGLRAWSRAEVVPPGEFRFYRATAGEQFVLDDPDRRLPVHLE